MKASCLLPRSIRSLSIALTAAVALILAISPSAAQQPPSHRGQMHALPLPRFQPRPGSTSSLLSKPTTAPAPSTLLNPTSWTPIGPASLNEGFQDLSGSYLTSGRVTGIAVDPTDPKTIYEASAGGGVWKTTDGGTTWTPLTDNQPTLAMGSIAVAPSNHLKIYAGTGEANNSGDSEHGDGILVSDDGGATWTLNSSGGALDGTAIGQIAVDPANASIAYAAVGTDSSLNGKIGVNEGIWKTTDGGTTWTNMTATLSLPNSTSPASVDWSAVVVDPNTPTIVYAAIGDWYKGVSNGIYRSTDSGTTWSLLANAPNGIDGKLGRIALAVSPAAKTTGQHVLYIASSNYTNYGLGYFQRSDNADAATPTFTDLSATTPDFLGGGNGSGQGWYDIAVNVDANGNVYCSGVENYNAGGADAIITSSNLGVTWNDISIINGFQPHTDNHAIAFDSNNNMLAGNDGGIYRYDPANPGWTDLNGNLNTIQFTGIGLHPTNTGVVIGGSQDNGTELYGNNLLWNEVFGGDGGYAQISQTNPSRCYQEYVDAAISTSSDGCQTWNPIYTNLFGNYGNFYTPYAVDPTNGDHIVVGVDYIDESTNAGTSFTAIGIAGVNGFNPNDDAAGSVAVSPANGKNPEVVYAAMGAPLFGFSSKIFVAPAVNGTATVWTEADLPACTKNGYAGIGCNVSKILTDPNDPTGATAFATVANFSSGSGGHVYMTTSEGGTWTDISGNLPNMPVWSIQVDTDSNKTAYISTDAGVYSSPSPYTTWTQFGTGLPNAQGYDLELNSNLHLLAVATHGRGAWEMFTQATLSVTKSGVGTGTVTSSPSGINCGSTCSAGFAGSASVTLTAQPGANSAVGAWTGCDSISSDGTQCSVDMTVNKSVSVAFTGLPTVTWPAAGAITYGQMLSASALSGGSASFNSSTVPGAFAFDSPATGPKAGLQSEAVTFTPTDTTTYAVVHGTVMVTVNQAVPTITWSTPAAITYGTALSATQLDASSTVAGTLTYAPAAGAILGAGTQNLKVTFTPTDAVDYTSNTKTVQLAINTAALLVKADDKAMAYSSTVPALTGTLTGVVTGDGITAKFATTATSASTVGKYAITAALNDPNSKLANYTVTNTPGTLTVGQATPPIQWSAPAAITYGTALSSTQLNASSSVKGTFAYSPAAGTVLGAGSQTLKTTFTPADATDYTTANGSVLLTVNQATPAIGLTSSQNPLVLGQPVTFTATLTAPAGTTPTGTVTFWDGTTQIGSGKVSAGVATLASSALAVGAHSIAAQYSGDANFASVTSTALAQAVIQFSIGTASGGSATGSGVPGGFVTYQLTVTPPSNNSVTFTVTGLPKGFTATFTPNTVPTGAGPTNVTLTIHIPSQVSSAAQVPARPGSSSHLPYALGLLLLPLLGIGRSGRRLSRSLLLALLAVAGLAATLGLSGCSHNFSSFNNANNNPPPPGSYALTVTAAAGSQTQSTTLTLNVQ